MDLKLDAGGGAGNFPDRLHSLYLGMKDIPTHMSDLTRTLLGAPWQALAKKLLLTPTAIPAVSKPGFAFCAFCFSWNLGWRYQQGAQLEL